MNSLSIAQRGCLALALLWAAAPARAASPGLGGVSPVGAQRGREVEVVFQGERLADAQQILLYEPGISVTHLEPAGAAAVKTRLKIEPDCRLGMHAVRVRTASGISNLRTFAVGALQEAKEVEPNNDFTKPQKIGLDTTITGVADNEDVDYYLVEAKKGERISVEVEGMRLGNTFFDPYASIMDQGRFELARTDDSPLLKHDPFCGAVAPADGQYVIQVRESAFAGNGGCVYRLHVGRFPRPATVIPAGGKPGETVAVRWIGDVAGDRSEQVTLPAAPQAGFRLFARDERGLAPSGIAFPVGELGNLLEVEPNDAPPQATPFTAPLALAGVIEKLGDVDCFKFAAKKGQAFDVRVSARAIGSPLDSVLYVNRSSGAGVAGNDDSGGADSSLRFTAPEDDQYVVVVHDQLRKGGPEFTYRIEVAPVKPQLVLGLPERSQFVDVTAPVPAGNRLALMVSASRIDFGGDLNLELKDLPPGMTAEVGPLPANRGETPVLLSVADGAAPAGALVDLVARPADPNLKLEGRLRQRTSLVRGQNNIEVWNQYTERMAASVAQAVPFRIEIVEPKAPIVRNGNLDLKVVATRAAGFNAPIAVRMLYNPPGIGSNASIAIPEGKNEAVIPVTANDGAEINKWKVAVLGEATVGDGPVLVSTQLATLEVAEPFVSFGFQSAAVEQGQATDLVVKIEKKRDFDGDAKVELVGLPNEVTSEPRQFNAQAKELVFPLKTTGKSPAGRHKTVLCRAVITVNGEPVNHTLGTGELRIDTPLPPKVAAAPAPMPAAAPAPMPAPPAEKRLSRLEKLRQDRAQAAPTDPAKK